MTRRRLPEKRKLARRAVLVDREPYPTLAAAFRACGLSTHDAPYRLSLLKREKELDRGGLVFTLIESGFDDRSWAALHPHPRGGSRSGETERRAH